MEYSKILQLSDIMWDESDTEKERPEYDFRQILPGSIQCAGLDGRYLAESLVSLDLLVSRDLLCDADQETALEQIVVDEKWNIPNQNTDKSTKMTRNIIIIQEQHKQQDKKNTEWVQLVCVGLFMYVLQSRLTVDLSNWQVKWQATNNLAVCACQNVLWRLL